jgi:phage baseplate assembly protein W
MTAHPAYGVGFAFPLAPAGGFATVAGADAVDQALRILLLTEPGERIGRPSYGVGLRRFLDAPNSLSTRTLIRERILEAIHLHEPRVALQSLEVRPHPSDEERIDIHIAYVLAGAQAAAAHPKNLVFPFYLDGRTR